MIASEHFFPTGWFFLIDSRSGAKIGLAINGYGPDFEEGFVDWIQVRASHRRRGLGAALLRESLRRLQHARFVTAAGSLDPRVSAAELFSRFGFGRSRQWTILGPAPEA
jgi:GNAT superfamily N-acetyltransferase